MSALSCALAPSVAFKDLLDSRTHLLFVRQPLVVDPFSEELIEIKVIRHQEVDITRVHLHSTLPHDARGWEHVEIEWSNRMHLLLCVPLESSQPYLEGIHPLTAVLELLIPVFDGVIVISLIVMADAQPRELRVEGNEIRSGYRSFDKGQRLQEIAARDVHYINLIN